MDVRDETKGKRPAWGCKGVWGRTLLGKRSICHFSYPVTEAVVGEKGNWGEDECREESPQEIRPGKHGTRHEGGRKSVGHYKEGWRLSPRGSFEHRQTKESTIELGGGKVTKKKKKWGERPSLNNAVGVTRVKNK